MKKECSVDTLVTVGAVVLVCVLFLLATGIAYATGVKRGEIDLMRAELMVINLRQYICDIGMRLDFEDWLNEKYADNKKENL